MENQLGQLAIHCWTGFVRPFLTATLLGLLAGACFSDLARAAPAAGTHAVADSAALPHLVAGAGRVRQQAQRIAKLYQQIGMGLDADRARRQFDLARRQVDSDISGLKRAATADKTAALVERVVQAWETLKRDSEPPFSRNSRDKVFAQADELAMLSGRLAMQFELNASTSAARLLDLSLRQGMLAQRLARLYLTAYAGDKSAGLLVDIEQARREFASALDELSGAAENTEASRRALELARVQWMFFEQSLFGMKDRLAGNPMHVATSSERILEVLDEVSLQYANASQPGALARKKEG